MTPRHPHLRLPRVGYQDPEVEELRDQSQDLRGVPRPFYVWVAGAPDDEPVQIVQEVSNNAAAEHVLIQGLQQYIAVAEPYVQYKDAEGHDHIDTPLAVCTLENGDRAIVGEVTWPGDRIVSHRDIRRMLNGRFALLVKFWRHLAGKGPFPGRFEMGDPS